MRYKIPYTVIVFILSLVMTIGVKAQNNHKGSWTLSSVQEGSNYQYQNHQLVFNNNGIAEIISLDDGLIE